MHPVSISKESRIDISMFIAFQYVRTKEYRAMIKESGAKFMTQIIKDDPEFKNANFKITMKDELAKALQAETMVSYSVPQVGWLLYSSRWTLLINRTSLPFWTSDNPVALCNPIDYGDKSGVGFAVKGIQIHLPINSELLLLVLDPTSYNLSAIKIIKKPEQITDENKIRLYNATRFVISSDADFSLAKKLREEDETLRERQERVILRKVALSGTPIIQLSNKMKVPPS